MILKKVVESDLNIRKSILEDELKKATSELESLK
jgi:hypothetical protein